MKSATRLLVALPILLSGFLTGFSTEPSAFAGDTMSPEIATALGLEEVWRRQLKVYSGAQSIADQQLYVHENDQIEYVELRQTGGDASVPADDESRVLLRIPVNQVSKEGLPIAKEEAQRQARAEIRRLKRRGITAEIAERKVARVDLLTVCDDGALECRNAETGSPIWLARIGDQELPFGTIGVNDKYVTVTNGGNLIKLALKDGTEINSTRTSGTPLFGSMVSGNYALVATIRNAVEGYPLYDTTREPFMEIVAGLALAPPTKAPKTSRVAWGTDRGFVYCMELSGEPSVIFRIETDGIVGGRLASAEGDRFFFGSENGQVYGLRATREGQVLWSRPYGEPFYNAPLVVDDQLLIRSAYGNLYCLDVKSGVSNWTSPVPSVDELIASFDGKVFVRTLSGSVSVIDLESGKLTAAIRSLRPEKLLVNRVTNRLYFVSQRGTVQCLRPVGTKLPTVVGNAEPKSDPAAATDPNAAPADPNMTKPATDPFGAGKAADPFGAGPGTDPFDAGGNAADPFAPAGGADAGGGAQMADPFAPAGGANGAPTADDPFGGDPFGN